LANVIDRVEIADLYQTSLYSFCGQYIRRNLKILKKDAKLKWLELKKKSPGLALAILEEFAEEDVDAHYVQICYNCGNYGHFVKTCPNK
jgi:hypothetical protein